MSRSEKQSLNPVDLRGILHYVPIFRGEIFVVSLDGSLVYHDNLQQIVTDLAVLRSLSIKVLLVHGIGHTNAGEGLVPSAGDVESLNSSVPTDARLLSVAERYSAASSLRVFHSLSGVGMKCVIINALRAVQKGILHGVDHQFTGRLDSCDVSSLQQLMNAEMVPMFSPIVPTTGGQLLRLNPDELAAELAIRVGASKLIFLTDQPTLRTDGVREINMPLSELENLLEKRTGEIRPALLSKAREAARVLKSGPKRAHILDGTIADGLITEIFDKVGTGTMIHANAYQQIRQARKKDSVVIRDIIRAAAKTEALRIRTLRSIETQIENFFVYEIDGSIIACACLTPQTAASVELASVLVQPFYQGKGVGSIITEFAIDEARKRGFRRVVALSTQTADFFIRQFGFVDGSTADLSPARAEDYEHNRRNSRILVKDIC